MFQALLTRFRALRQRRRAVREMDDELRFHVEMETQANLQRGMSPIEARRVALSEFGGVEATRDAIRDVRTFWLDSLWQDLRYALRAAFRQSGSTFTAATMLGLAVGLTTAMFTVADALILRPVPFEAADDLAMVYMGNERGGRGTVAPAVFEAWQESGAFAGVESAAADKVVVESGNTVAVLQYGVTVGDPVSWLLVLGMLGATTIVAAWRPASEAMGVDPVHRPAGRAADGVSSPLGGT